MKGQTDPRSLTVSVIVPCKNERGNIEAAAKRIPLMGRSTEIIFCDDRSTDGTAQKVLEMQKKHAGRNILLVRGPDQGKAENVRAGFEAATGDVLMILDADLTVMPEELPAFFNAIVEDRGDLVNGTRFIHPMGKNAMGRINKIGNRVFSRLFTCLLSQTITDTLCGTKALWRSDWERMQKYRGSWGARDRWGDFELLLGARMAGLAIIEVPVHYQERIHGESKMVNVFRDGLVMMRICWNAFLKLKLDISRKG